MLIVQRRVKTFDCAIKASYARCFGPSEVTRSITCEASPGNCPRLSSQCSLGGPAGERRMGVGKADTSITSVSPSHLPLDQPIHESMGASVGFPILISRRA